MVTVSVYLKTPVVHEDAVVVVRNSCRAVGMTITLANVRAVLHDESNRTGDGEMAVLYRDAIEHLERLIDADDRKEKQGKPRGVACEFRYADGFVAMSGVLSKIAQARTEIFTLPRHR